MRAVAAAIALTLGACAPSTVPATETDLGHGTSQGVSVITDPLTGCEYLTLYDHGITPRLSKWGKPMCPGIH